MSCRSGWSDKSDRSDRSDLGWRIWLKWVGIEIGDCFGLVCCGSGRERWVWGEGGRINQLEMGLVGCQLMTSSLHLSRSFFFSGFLRILEDS